MEFAIYNGKQKVKILGTEEGLYHIEFENGASILCDKTEIIIIKELV